MRQYLNSLMKMITGVRILLTSEELKMKKLKYIAVLMTMIFITNSIVISAVPEPLNLKNVAPTINLSVTPKKKPVDIVILTDYTGTKLSSLNTQINALKANFAAVSVDPIFHVINDVTKIGTQSDELYMFRRYARFKYQVHRYSTYSLNNSWDYFNNYNFEQNILWEEMPWLASQVSTMPKRNPTNVNYSKSSLIHWENSSGSTERDYWNVTVSCSNDVRTSATVEQEYFYESNTAVRSWDYLNSESFAIDKSFAREEKISNVTYDVLSLDFSKLNTLPLRAGSDRHMILLSDSYGKNYGAGLGNYFSFGDMTDTLKNYITANKFSLYGVIPDETRDMSLLPDKVSRILPLGNTSLFYMRNGEILQLGDSALANTLPYGSKIFPKTVSDIGAVKEVINTSGMSYWLMNDGTIKYVPSGSSTITTLSGISGVTKVFSSPSSSNVFYAINSSGQAFKIYDVTVQPFNNSFFCDKVCSAGYDDILIASDGTPYMQYSVYNSQYKTTTYGFSQVRIRDRDTDALSYLGAIKDVKFVSSGYSLFPIAVQFASDWVRQYEGVGSDAVFSGKNTYYYPCLYAQSAYNIDTTGVDRIEYTGADILIYYKNGAVKSLAPTLRLVHDSEEGNYYVVEFRNYLVNVPLTNIQKTVSAYPKKYFMTDINNNTYMYDGASTTYLGNNIKGVYASRMNYTNSKIYMLKNDGTVRELTYHNTSLISDKILPYNNIENIYVSNSNAYLVDKKGYVYGTGNSNYGQLGYKDAAQYITTYVNPLPSTISLINTTKTYLSILDLFNSIASDCEFYGTGQYAAAFSRIYDDYQNNGDGSTYVILGDDLEYQSTYGDYESDPEHSRQWRISHNPDYFDNSMGLSAYHNPAGFTNTPPVKLDKVGRYIINLKVRDNPKDDNRFDNYRLWSVGDQNLYVYVHRKPIALQRITVAANGNGTYTVRAYDAGSYDLDHTVSRVDKGIVAREWRWKDSTNFNWHYEQINKADCYPDSDYIIQLRVQDAEGAWSDYNTIEIANNPPVALFDIEKNPIFTTEKLLVKDKSFPQSFFPIDRWHWIVKKYNDDGALPPKTIYNEQFETSNDGTESMEGYDTNIKTDYADTGEGKYRIYLRVRDGNGLWSDGGTDGSYNLNSFYAQDIVVEESFRLSSFRVLKVRDLHLESYYYNSVTGRYDDKPINVNDMAVDYQNFGGAVDGLTKGYLFEYEIDTINFNEDTDTISVTPHFYTCNDFSRDTEERELYWENSYHEVLKAGEGGHSSWAVITLGMNDRTATGENTATWRGSYLIPGTAWAVAKGTSAADAKESRINSDIIVNFEIKGCKNGVMQYNYNLQQWPLERTAIKNPYEVGDVIRYSHLKCNLDDNEVILNRP